MYTCVCCVGLSIDGSVCCVCGDWVVSCLYVFCVLMGLFVVTVYDNADSDLYIYI